MKLKLLIYWHPRNIKEIILPIINELNGFFDIYIILENDNLSSEQKNFVKKLKNDLFIIEYYIASDNKNIFSLLKYYKRLSKEISYLNFDLFLTNNNAHLIEKIICDKIINKNTKVILLWPSITFLFMRYPSNIKKVINGATFEDLKFRKFNNNKIKSKNSIIYILKYILNNIRNSKRIIRLLKNNIIYNFFYPLIIFQKIYLKNKKELLTQISKGNFSQLIFFDDLEAEIHKQFFQNDNIHSLLPSKNLFCKCGNNQSQKNNLLIPLSGYEKYLKAPDTFIQKLVNDINIITKNIEINEVHLRSHPDFINLGWSKQLKDELIRNKIETRVVDCINPIREVICDYICIAGFASNALRDARLACDNVLIIGFEAVSTSHFEDPKFVFGETNNINWINKDGSYSRDIFNKPNIKKRDNQISVAQFLIKIIRKL